MHSSKTVTFNLGELERIFNICRHLTHFRLIIRHP